MNTQNIWLDYSSELRSFIQSKVKNIAITEDILQDTFIKIHTKLDTLKDPKKLKPWLFSVARNTVFTYFKSNNYAVEANLLEEDIDTEEPMHTEKDCLAGIIKNLPKKYRDPIFLSDIKGLKQQEVAKELGQTLSTTKSQIQRGRKLIAKGYMDCCGYVLNAEGKLIGETKDREDCKVCATK